MGYRVNLLMSRELTATDSQLVRDALAADRVAWETLFRRYNARLFCVAHSFRLDDATCEDVVQTAWTRLIEHLGTLRDPGSVGAWLTTTLRREIFSVLRDRGRAVLASGFDVADIPDRNRSPEEEVIAADRDTQIRAALRRLPARDCLLLTFLMASPSPSYGDVSTQFGMPVGSIGPTRARSLSRLRRELDAVGLDREPAESAVLLPSTAG